MRATDFVRVERTVDAMAAQRPDHPALIFSDRRWSYAALRAEMDRRAPLLVTAGLQPGDIIASTEPASDDLAITFLACCRADLSLLYLSPKLLPAELSPLLERAAVKAMLTANGEPHPAHPTAPCLPLGLPGVAGDAAVREAQRRSADGTPEAVAAILATSGTTGSQPKLVRVPHREQTWRREPPASWETADGIYYTPRRFSFNPRHLAIVWGIGGTTVLGDTLNPERMENEMAAHRAAVLWTVPAVVRLLTERTQPPPAGLALRFIRCGSAPLPPAVARAAAQRYGATVVQSYGSVESGLALGTPPGGAPEGSVGTPYPGAGARIVDEAGADVPEGAVGMLIVRCPGMMRGYLGDPDATAGALRDGWLWMGDLARRDADGFYFLEGRRGSRINVGGLKVAPEEVEEVLERHPAVREAVVLAMADAARGEAVRAIIVPAGAAPPVAELRRWCRERLAAYKVPRRWEFRDELPRSALGKVQRQRL